MIGFETSAECNEVVAAFVAAKRTFGPVVSSRIADTGSYQYNYANLADVFEAIDEALLEQGIVISQPVTGTEAGRILVATVLMHTSGQWIAAGPLPMPTGNTPQATGSAITYARRYALLSALGVPTEDDDGARAETAVHQARQQARPPQNRNQQPQRPAQQRPAPQGQPRREEPRQWSDTEAACHRAIASVTGQTAQDLRAEFVRHFGTNMSRLPAERHAEALTFINETIARLSEYQPDEVLNDDLFDGAVDAS